MYISIKLHVFILFNLIYYKFQPAEHHDFSDSRKDILQVTMITTSMIVTNIILLMQYAYFNNLNQEKNINTEHGMLLLELII